MAKDHKKTLKPLILEVQGLSESLMLTRLKILSLVLAVKAACPCLCATIFMLDWPTMVKITFRGYHSLMSSCAGFLEPRRSRLEPLKSTFNAENFILACPFLFLVILVQIALEMCVAARNRQKINKAPILMFKVVDFDANRKRVCDFLLVINSNSLALSRSVSKIRRRIG